MSVDVASSHRVDAHGRRGPRRDADDGKHARGPLGGVLAAIVEDHIDLQVPGFLGAAVRVSGAIWQGVVGKGVKSSSAFGVGQSNVLSLVSPAYRAIVFGTPWSPASLSSGHAASRPK